MEVVELAKDKVSHWYDTYLYFLTQADKRVADWPLMQSYAPTWALTCLYLFAVWAGPKLMAKREPFQLKHSLILYNFALIALNFHIFYELITASWRLNYSYSCQPVSYSNDPDEMRIAKALWWYYISKVVEFLDTIFFVLRKKNGQISFLHVYHHATMFPIWWIGVKWVAGGQSFFGATMNSFIHVLMYGYYGISALGPQFQKYLWWKKYLTVLQLIQFLAGMAHAVQSLLVDCNYPKWMQWTLIFYGFSIFSLFMNFFIHAYTKPKGKKTVKGSENGHVTNGHAVTNGVNGNKARNGKTKKEQ